MNWEEIKLWIEEHPLATAGIAVGVAGIAVLAMTRGKKGKSDQGEEPVAAMPVGRLLDAYPPSVMMGGTQVVTIRPPSNNSPQPPSPVAPNNRRFTGVAGLSCPRGSKLQQRSDGTWTCISDRTGKEIPIRERTSSGWRPVQ